jgi:type VI secretion system protein ImpM
MIREPSCIGKLPSHGDFVRIRVNQTQKTRLDAWFAQVGSKNVFHSGQVEPNTAKGCATPWCFAIRADFIGASKHMIAIGVLVQSYDKIGRSYPLMVYQIVPKRWLYVQMQASQNWLYSLSLCLKSCFYHDKTMLDQELKRIWSIYMPHWYSIVSVPKAIDRERQTRKVRNTLNLSPPTTEVQGVIHPPFANWAQQLSYHNNAMVWWKLDEHGRYLDVIEAQQLDAELLHNLLQT